MFAIYLTVQPMLFPAMCLETVVTVEGATNRICHGVVRLVKVKSQSSSWCLANDQAKQIRGGVGV